MTSRNLRISPQSLTFPGLRLLGIGRNQYIDLMNQSRSTRKFAFFKKSCRDLLPQRPVDSFAILPWWQLQVGYVTEDDMKVSGCPFSRFTAIFQNDMN